MIVKRKLIFGLLLIAFASIKANSQSNSFPTNGNATIADGNLIQSGAYNIQTQGAVKLKNYLLFDSDGDFTGNNYFTIQDDVVGNYLRIGYLFNNNMVLTSNGYFGIGTTSPSGLFEVDNGSQYTSLTGNNIQFSRNDGPAYFHSKNVGGYMTFVTNGRGLGNANANMVLQSNMNSYFNGNVGIGTPSPDRPFVVKSSEFGTYSGGVHFAHSNGTQGIEFGYAGFKKTTTNGNGNLSIDAADNDHLLFQTQNVGNVGIGTTSPSSKLEVDGTITSEEVKVEVVGAPDYVFAPEYQLRSLKDTEEYIKANSHLPEIPSAREMETNGIELGEMNMLLLKKIEELTLHLIELKNEVETLKLNIK